MRRFLLLAAALLGLVSGAQAQTTAQKLTLLSGQIRPAVDLNFTTGVLDGRITFTRASTATYFGSNGLLQTASSGAPRFTYDPATLTALGLLIEESRTNLQTQSQAATGWSASNGTLTTNNAVAPDSTTTAATFADNTSNAAHFTVTPVTSWVSGTTYVSSVFLQPGTGQFAQMTYPAAQFSGVGYANFDLSSGTVSATGGTLVASGIVPLRNGWYRCWIAATATASGSASFGTASVGSGTASRLLAYAGTGTTFNVWGQQVEAAAFPSSYIPTTTASVTRAADVATMTLASLGIPANPAGLTIIGKARTGVGGATAGYVFAISDGSSSNALAWRLSTTIFNPIMLSGGVSQWDLSTFSNPPGNTSESFWAAAAPSNSAAQVLGQPKQTAGVGVMPVGVTKIDIGNLNSANFWNSTIARLQIYNRRLPDSTAAQKAQQQSWLLPANDNGKLREVA